jgi:hypothetical protein
LQGAIDHQQTSGIVCQIEKEAKTSDCRCDGQEKKTKEDQEKLRPQKEGDKEEKISDSTA